MCISYLSGYAPPSKSAQPQEIRPDLLFQRSSCERGRGHEPAEGDAAEVSDVALQLAGSEPGAASYLPKERDV